MRSPSTTSASEIFPGIIRGRPRLFPDTIPSRPHRFGISALDRLGWVSRTRPERFGCGFGACPKAWRQSIGEGPRDELHCHSLKEGFAVTGLDRLLAPIAREAVAITPSCPRAPTEVAPHFLAPYRTSVRLSRQEGCGELQEAFSPSDQGLLREYNDDELRRWVEVEHKTQAEIAKLVGRSQGRVSRRCSALGIASGIHARGGRPRVIPGNNSDAAEVVEGEIVAPRSRRQPEGPAHHFPDVAQSRPTPFSLPAIYRLRYFGITRGSNSRSPCLSAGVFLGILGIIRANNSGSPWSGI